MPAIETLPELALTDDFASSASFEVKDLALAEFGRDEIRLAEHEMPGLMALREGGMRASAP